jgi:hypothetical protein
MVILLLRGTPPEDGWCWWEAQQSYVHAAILHASTHVPTGLHVSHEERWPLGKVQSIGLPRRSPIKGICHDLMPQYATTLCHHIACKHFGTYVLQMRRVKSLYRHSSIFKVYRPASKTSDQRMRHDLMLMPPQRVQRLRD